MGADRIHGKCRRHERDCCYSPVSRGWSSGNGRPYSNRIASPCSTVLPGEVACRVRPRRGPLGKAFLKRDSISYRGIEVLASVAAQWYRDPCLDRIGPARYAEIADLHRIRPVREVLPIPVGSPECSTRLHM